MVAFTNLKQYEVTKDSIKEFALVELSVTPFLTYAHLAKVMLVT